LEMGTIKIRPAMQELQGSRLGSAQKRLQGRKRMIVHPRMIRGILRRVTESGGGWGGGGGGTGRGRGKKKGEKRSKQHPPRDSPTESPRDDHLKRERGKKGEAASKGGERALSQYVGFQRTGLHQGTCRTRTPQLGNSGSQHKHSFKRGWEEGGGGGERMDVKRKLKPPQIRHIIELDRLQHKTQLKKKRLE